MHKFGKSFVATATPPGGTAQTLYQTTSWDEPKPTVFSTPLHLPSGTTISRSCTDVNTTGQILTFGEYAQTNVMCISPGDAAATIGRGIESGGLTRAVLDGTDGFGLDASIELAQALGPMFGLAGRRDLPTPRPRGHPARPPLRFVS